MGNWKTYKNGNYITRINLDDGTRIRETEDDNFIPSFAENMDIKIIDRCDMKCEFCHEGSTPDGKMADIMNEKFIDTLHPYQEVALGGGNVLEHPDLIPFLQKLKNMNVITNITLNQIHFEKNIDMIDMMVKEKLIYGLGVSLVNPTDEFIEKVKRYSNAVIHLINGIVSNDDIEKLADNNLKILMLGYKHLRRGNECYENNIATIQNRQRYLYYSLPKIIKKFKVVSFDNLAIEQLHVERILSKDEWDEFYQGDDGTSTYYIDMVERKFAKSSTAPFDQRYDLLDNVDDMFKKIRDLNFLHDCMDKVENATESNIRKFKDIYRRYCVE